MFKTIDPARDVTVAAVSPCPVLMCSNQYGEVIADDLDAMATCYGIEIVRAAKRFLQYRCVALDRLPTILRTGRDGEPADGVFWSAERIEKALEYGGREQVVMVYDPRRLKSAWIQIEHLTEERRDRTACSSVKPSDKRDTGPGAMQVSAPSRKGGPRL